jgi:hypothetical protein
MADTQNVIAGLLAVSCIAWLDGWRRFTIGASSVATLPKRQ